MILSAQFISSLCSPNLSFARSENMCRSPVTGDVLPMISPFVNERQVRNGMSYGLSSASYDLRVAHDLRLPPSPSFTLAHTLEDFAIPHNVVGFVCDKSSYARLGVSCFNTLFDPGFIGNATLELVNHSGVEVVIKEGDPICQIVFQWLDAVTTRPDRGKYQRKEATQAIREPDTAGEVT
jgi:deoxycytidine triphosphate deaminase